MARKPVPPSDHRKRPLEPPENAEVRDTLDDRRHWKWLRALMLASAQWMVAVGAATLLFRERLTEAFEWLLGKGGN